MSKLIIAKGGALIGDVIDQALLRVQSPDVPYAYFQFNGVIVTADKASTHTSLHADYQKRLGVLCQAMVAVHGTA